MADANLVSRLYRVRKTVNQMLRKRGYLVQDEEDMTREEFRGRFGDQPRRKDMMILASKVGVYTDQILVFFAEPDREDAKKKIGVKPLRTFVEHMDREKIYRAIIIVSSDVTPYARQILQSLEQQEANGQRYQTELFREAELLVDITEHVLVPEHVVLTDDEKKAVLSKYKLEEKQLPRIQKSDPVARYFGLQRGQVVKIIRPSETAGRFQTYRICV